MKNPLKDKTPSDSKQQPNVNKPSDTKQQPKVNKPSDSKQQQTLSTRSWFGMFSMACL